MNRRQQPARRFVVVALVLAVVLFFLGYHRYSPAPTLAVSREAFVETWQGQGPLKRRYDNVFSFGDSLTWTNQNSEVDMPTTENPFGTVYPGITQAGGPNWLGFLWHDYLPKALLFNFAQSGAHVSSGEFGDAEDRQNDVIRQVDLFVQKLHQPHGLPTWEPQHTLFTMWLGTNDVYGAFYRKKGASIFDDIIQRLFRQIDRLAEVGAEEFLLMTPEPVHLVRLHDFGNPLHKPLQKLVYDWNAKLRSATEAWHRRTGKRVHLVDVTALVEKALDDKVARPCSCVEDELPHDECMWEDKFHLGSLPNRMIAEKCRSALML